MFAFGLFLSLISLPVFAINEITSQVHDIDYGTGPNDQILILLTSGDVVKLHHSREMLNEKFKKSISKKIWYQFSIDKERFITNAKEATPTVEKEEKFQLDSPESPFNYIPTTVKDMETAQRYHNEARYNPKESQCFNRAMVWSYEWWINHSLKSNKLLIYFSRTYIRKYDFEWWFHIAPYIHVIENGKVVERVMDIKYSSRPLEFQKWANIFLRNDAPCPVITKYSEYADYPYTGDCFFQRTHMYTYQPADLQMYEAWGYEKNNFRMEEVRGAYLEAFNEKI